MTRQKAVLLLGASGFELYLGDTRDIAIFNFQPTFVKDLEVVNRDELKKQLNGFLEANKIPPLDVVTVLADSILFQTEFSTTQEVKQPTTQQPQAAAPATPPPINPEQLLNEIQKYIDSIPFQNVSTKTFKSDKGIKVIGTNRELYEVIKEVFDTKEILIDFVAPLSVLERELSSIQALDKITAKKILQRINLLKQHALEMHYEFQPIEQSGEEGSSNNRLKRFNKKDRKRIFALAGIFGILLTILGAMIIFNYILPSQQPKKVLAPTPSLTQQEPPPPSPTPQVTQSAELSPLNLAIQIKNGTGIANQAKSLQGQLEKSGFSNITIDPGTPPTTTNNTLMQYKGTVSLGLRGLITNELQKSYSNVLTEEIAGGDFDVVITTGKPR